MGVLRGRRDDADVRRFRMKQKLASIGDDFWIEDEDGNRAFRVDGKKVRVRNTFVLEDTSGREVARIQERKVSVRDKVVIDLFCPLSAELHVLFLRSAALPSAS